MGNKYSKAYPDFGRRVNYIEQINGRDSIIKNSDDRIQKFSGFKQWDITQKFLFKPNSSATHLLNFQMSNSTNVPRYDRLQDTRNFGGAIGTVLRFAEWYYGPQKRYLGAYEFNLKKTGFFNEIKSNINYQLIEESRQTREYRRYDMFDSQVEKVKVFGTTISGRKIMDRNELVLGGDIQLNDVKSTAKRTNLTNGNIAKLNTRYPDGENRMSSFGMYAQHIYKFKNEKLVLNDGMRFQLTTLKSNVLDNSFFNLPDTAVVQRNFAVTGNLGIIFSPTKRTGLKAAISSGFRVPNIDDLSKVFESNTAALQVVLPNADLKPEYTYNIDLSITQQIFKDFSIEVTGFYSLFRNAIIKAPFTLNGQDSINYNGIRSQILASQNVNHANLFGFNVNMTAVILEKLSFNSTLSFTYGRYSTDVTKQSSVYEKQTNGSYEIVNKNVTSRPLDHIPPLIGKTSVTYQHKKINAEIYTLYNGWKSLNKYNSDGEDNAQYATQHGMPAWFTLNAKASLFIKKYLQLQLGIENILDRNYRSFASGFSAGGRNFIFALRSTW